MDKANSAIGGGLELEVYRTGDDHENGQTLIKLKPHNSTSIPYLLPGESTLTRMIKAALINHKLLTVTLAVCSRPSTCHRL